MLEVFRSRKMMAIALLGFSSGMPLYLTSRTLQAWLSVEGASLTSIGLFSLASLPYSLKFLWSPLMDRFTFPLFGRAGRRKGWVLFLQCVLILAIASMALHQPRLTLEWMALNAALIAFLSASQDIVIDAYRADIATTTEAAAAASIHVVGYRAALIVTFAGALPIAELLSWPQAYLLLAGLMAVVALFSIAIPEPALQGVPPRNLREAVYLPFADFFSRLGKRRGWMILGFILLFRLGDFVIGNMTTPFLLDIGFTLTDVGAVQGAVGIAATIAGALAGGALAARIGLLRALWIAGALQALSNLTYVILAQAGPNYRIMVSTVVIENVCYGLATGTLVGFLMSLCNPRFSATQYALLSSVISAGRDILVSYSGALAQMLGWPAFFVVSLIAALPGLALLPIFAPWAAGNAQLRTDTARHHWFAD